MDGTFSDLNADSLAVELDDFTKDMHKLMKVFVNRHKKQQMQRDERERERKKNFRRQSRRSTTIDPSDLVALQKVEAELAPPVAIGVCTKVLAQQNDFKVNSMVHTLSESSQSFQHINYFGIYL